MNRRQFLQVATGTTVVGLAGCIGRGSQASGDYDIGMSASAFRPDTHRVEVGTTVVWKNTSKQGHTVTAYGDDIPSAAEYFASGGFDSQEEAESAYLEASGDRGVLGADEEFTHEFTMPGTYDYYCIPHENAGMLGKIVVESAGTASGNSTDS